MSDRSDNVVFVGSRPPMNYVLAVATRFHDGAEEVVIRARGRAITNAVDVAEIVRGRFLNDVRPASIEIGTDAVEREGGGKANVSTISITLRRS